MMNIHIIFLAYKYWKNVHYLILSENFYFQIMHKINSCARQLCNHVKLCFVLQMLTIMAASPDYEKFQDCTVKTYGYVKI